MKHLKITCRDATIETRKQEQASEWFCVYERRKIAIEKINMIHIDKHKHIKCFIGCQFMLTIYLCMIGIIIYQLIYFIVLIFLHCVLCNNFNDALTVVNVICLLWFCTYTSDVCQFCIYTKSLLLLYTYTKLHVNFVYIVPVNFTFLYIYTKKHFSFVYIYKTTCQFCMYCTG